MVRTTRGQTEMAAKRIADYLGRTFQEWLPKQRRWREGTVLLLRASGNRYEMVIAEKTAGKYIWITPHGLSVTGTQLWDFEHMLSSMNRHKRKTMMKKLKTSKLTKRA